LVVGGWWWVVVGSMGLIECLRPAD